MPTNPSLILINNSECQGENIHIRVSGTLRVLRPGESACFLSDGTDWSIDMSLQLETNSTPVPFYDVETKQRMVPKPKIHWERNDVLEDWEQDVGVPLPKSFDVIDIVSLIENADSVVDIETFFLQDETPDED